jgi:hypothetical protein
VISIDEDYDYEMFHLVLSYLYTDRICFSDSPGVKPDDETLTTCDVEGVYAVSGPRRLNMESLQRKAFHFLKATTNLQNITDRVFGTFAAEHTDVGKWYDEYFTDHWDEIRKLQEHEQSMTRLEEPCDVNSRRVTKKFRKMLRERK